MYPHANCAPVSHLIDDFDGDMPWHCYWDVRFKDDDYPGNDQYNLVHSVPMRNWTMQNSRLVFPTYVWKNGSPTPPTLGKMLLVKLKWLPPPFTFQLAFNFASLTVGPATSPFRQLGIQSWGFLDSISTASSSLAYIVGFNLVGLTGYQRFANNSFDQGQDVLYTFRVEADRTCQWDLLVNGVRPPLHVQSGDWPPGTPKVAQQQWVDSLELYYSDYIPIRFYPVRGGELEYLEIRLHDHTA